MRGTTVRKSLVFFGSALIAALAALIWWVWTRQLNPISTPGLSEISQLTGLSFPSGARLLGSRFVGRAGLLQAKIEIDRADWDGFLERSPLPIAAPGLGRGALRNEVLGPGRSPAWWEPDSVSAHVLLRKEPSELRPGAVGQTQLLADVGRREQTVIVYLVYIAGY